MNIALFLGAGASASFEKPTTSDLKYKLLRKYIPLKAIDSTYSFLNSVLSYDKFQDIEHVLQANKDIIDFANTLGGQYIMQPDNTNYFRTANMQVDLSSMAKICQGAAKLLENDIYENYAWDNTKDEDLWHVYGTLFDVLTRYTDDLHIFTTNYDRAIEEYCSYDTENYRYTDGFQLDHTKGRYLWEKDFAFHREPVHDLTDIYLYKLHGSLNWKRHRKYGIERTSEESKPNDPSYSDNLIIYPTVSPKDGNEKEPFKTIRDMFVDFMKTAHLCIVIGFSFRDQHINDIFLEYLAGGKHMIVISPSAINDVFHNLLKKDTPDGVGKEYQEHVETYQHDEGTFHFICRCFDKDRIDVIHDDIRAYIEKLPL